MTDQPACAAVSAAAASNAKQVDPQPVCYTTFDKQTKGLDGFYVKHGYNVKRNIKKQEQKLGQCRCSESQLLCWMLLEPELMD